MQHSPDPALMFTPDNEGFYNVVAPAKINLFLHVLGKQADGYHRLQSAFVLINLCDKIKLRPRKDGNVVRMNDVVGVQDNEDLSVRAARRLQEHSGSKLGVDIQVQKKIPMGAGLGGGSSDAASVLMALNRLWGIDYSNLTLQEIGLSLGADIPFFIFGKTAWVEGCGEKLTPLPLLLPDFVVGVPPIHVPTPTIFRDPQLKRDTLARQPADFQQWFNENALKSHPHQAGWRNDLQDVAERLYPDMRLIHTAWQQHWAVSHQSAPPLMMTGSGAGYFAPVAPSIKGRQTSIITYNSPPFLQGFYWQGSAFSRHPLQFLVDEKYALSL